MKLPLYVHYDYYGEILVCDDTRRVIFRLREAPENRLFARAVVTKLNRNWRYVLFGKQPYEYTREDWLFEKNV